MPASSLLGARVGTDAALMVQRPWLGHWRGLVLPLAVLVLHGAGLLPQRLQGLAAVLANPRLWLVLLLGFAFLRNLPWAPFTLLAPG